MLLFINFQKNNIQMWVHILSILLHFLKKIPEESYMMWQRWLLLTEYPGAALYFPPFLTAGPGSSKWVLTNENVNRNDLLLLTQGSYGSESYSLPACLSHGKQRCCCYFWNWKVSDFTLVWAKKSAYQPTHTNPKPNTHHTWICHTHSFTAHIPNHTHSSTHTHIYPHVTPPHWL